MPFLYQTRTIQHHVGSGRRWASAEASTPNTPSDHVPFKHGEDIKAVHDSSDVKTTITTTEKAVFERLFNKAAPEQSKQLNGEELSLHSIDPLPKAKKSGKAHTRSLPPSSTPKLPQFDPTSFPAPLQSMAATAAQKLQIQLEEIRIENEVDKQRALQNKTTKKQKVDPLQIDIIQKQKHFHKRLTAAQTDVELWNVLEREVFDPIEAFDLDGIPAVERVKTTGGTISKVGGKPVTANVSISKKEKARIQLDIAEAAVAMAETELKSAIAVAAAGKNFASTMSVLTAENVGKKKKNKNQQAETEAKITNEGKAKAMAETTGMGVGERGAANTTEEMHPVAVKKKMRAVLQAALDSAKTKKKNAVKVAKKMAENLQALDREPEVEVQVATKAQDSRDIAEKKMAERAEKKMAELAEKKMAELAEKKMAELAAIGPSIPKFLTIAIAILRQSFPTSTLPFTILPKLKSLGRSSYALGASTPFYNELIKAVWHTYTDFRMIDELLQEMDNGGLEFDQETWNILEAIRIEGNRIKNGRYGLNRKAVWGTDIIQNGWRKVIGWIPLVRERVRGDILRKREDMMREQRADKDRFDRKEEDVATSSADSGWSLTNGVTTAAI
jgi:hypothetical protein